MSADPRLSGKQKSVIRGFGGMKVFPTAPIAAGRKRWWVSGGPEASLPFPTPAASGGR